MVRGDLLLRLLPVQHAVLVVIDVENVLLLLAHHRQGRRLLPVSFVDEEVHSGKLAGGDEVLLPSDNFAAGGVHSRSRLLCLPARRMHVHLA